MLSSTLTLEISLLPRNNSTSLLTLRPLTNSTNLDGDLVPTTLETIMKIMLELKPVLKEMDTQSLREFMLEEKISSTVWLVLLPWTISEFKDSIVFWDSIETT